MKKFEDYFIPGRNLIHKRAHFYQWSQLPSEKSEAYIRVLYELAENCDFGDKRDEHVKEIAAVCLVDQKQLKWV